MKRKRDPLDRYYTPPPAIDALLEHAPEVCGGLLLDPCCGDGRMVRALQEAQRFSRAFTNDLDPEVEADEHVDAALDAPWRRWPQPDWVVTNPPWGISSEIVRLAVERARVGVAMLLRCTFLEPVKARTWLRELPPARVLCLSRMSFGTGGSDSAPAWWVVWSKATPLAGVPPIVVVPKKRGELQRRTCRRIRAVPKGCPRELAGPLEALMLAGARHG